MTHQAHYEVITHEKGKHMSLQLLALECHSSFIHNIPKLEATLYLVMRE